MAVPLAAIGLGTPAILQEASFNYLSFDAIALAGFEVAAYTRHSMVEVINLKRARKQKERANAQAAAGANRAAFGRTKAEKKLSQSRADAERRKLDGHKRDDT